MSKSRCKKRKRIDQDFAKCLFFSVLKFTRKEDFSFKCGDFSVSSKNFIAAIKLLFSLHLFWHQMIRKLDYWSRDMLNVDISEKGLGLVSPRHALYVFQEKYFSY